MNIIIKDLLVDILKQIKDEELSIRYVLILMLLSFFLVVLIFFGPKEYNDPILAGFYVILGSIITLSFSALQEKKNDKAKSSRNIDRYRGALISASVKCIDNLVTLNINKIQLESLIKAMMEKRYLSVTLLKYDAVSTKSIINNSLFSSIITLNQSLRVLTVNDINVEKIYYEMSHLAHSVFMNGKEPSGSVVNHDRQTVENASLQIIGSLEKNKQNIENQLNEINLHLENLDYTNYLNNPKEMIRQSLFYKPSKGKVGSHLEITKEQIELANKKYGLNEIITDL